MVYIFDTPMELNGKMSKDDGTPLDDPSIFRQIIGSLLYLAMTRPNITYAVHTVRQFVSNPHKPHLAAALRILLTMVSSTLLVLPCSFQLMRTLIGLAV